MLHTERLAAILTKRKLENGVAPDIVEALEPIISACGKWEGLHLAVCEVLPLLAQELGITPTATTPLGIIQEFIAIFKARAEKRAEEAALAAELATVEPDASAGEASATVEPETAGPEVSHDDV